jgi:hypothetical protein
MLGSPGSSEMSTVVPSLTLKVGRLLTRTAEDEKAKRARRALRARILKICLTDMIRRKEVLKIVEEEIGGNQGDLNAENKKPPYQCQELASCWEYWLQFWEDSLQ